MKRRSRAGRKPAKARPRKALKLKGQNAPKPVRNRRSAADQPEPEVAQLKRELHEALEQQTATAEILRISSSPGDLQPVFEAILENATRICEAKFGNLWLREGDKFRIVAVYGGSPEYCEYLFAEPLVVPDPQSAMGRVANNREVVQIDDISKARTYGMRMRIATIKIAKARTLVGVPLLKDNEAVGIVAIYRQEVRPFTDKQIELVQNFAAQAVIAIENTRLLNELRQRTTDLTESLEQQTATSEVLQVISSSPGDLEPVFAAMLENAARICDANFGNIFRWDGDAMHLVATHNTPPALAEARSRSPIRPSPGHPLGRMLATKAAVHVADLAADEAYTERRDPDFVAAVELGGIRTLLLVPMLKENELIGSFTVYRQEVRPFTDKQIALVTNFANQAVIAIENTRLLSELRELLQQQTATADVLKVISRSAFDLEAVLDTLTESAARLCEADMGTIIRQKGTAYYWATSYGFPPEVSEYLRSVPLEPGRGSGAGRVLLTGKTIHIPDVLTDPEYTYLELQRRAGFRSALGVPLLREGVPIGIVALMRRAVRPFTDKQIQLATTFADQAVIAIENTRLFEAEQQRTRELTEALEQQTATAEVLKVISRSTFDLQTVLNTLVESAARLCEADIALIVRPQGSNLEVLANYRMSQASIDVLTSTPIAGGRWTLSGRVLAEGRTVNIPDWRSDPGYTFSAVQEMSGLQFGARRPAHARRIARWRHELVANASAAVQRQTN